MKRILPVAFLFYCFGGFLAYLPAPFNYGFWVWEICALAAILAIMLALGELYLFRQEAKRWGQEYSLGYSPLLAIGVIAVCMTLCGRPWEGLSIFGLVWLFIFRLHQLKRD